MAEEKALTDAHLVELAKTDPESFGLLMERYQGQLSGYIRRLTRLSPDDVQDLLQEVFIKIYQNLNAYDRDLKFSSWAYRIAHNQVVDYFRRSGARPQTDVLEDYEWEKIVGGGIQLEKYIVNKDCAEKVKACIEDLPLNYREILILRFVEEKEYEEIMDILKKPKGSVATLIARGKEILRSKMEERNINCF
ncbi:MAG: sigma-70 family RNA polymerase sigma factor [Candidatus Moranbacteria bacterium]|nr:sigma-70 family RNA polymerase sigma factor [bacterium]MDP1834071.1 sigma-70 family RNA polymerase sigma factor [Candidatus Moranbacteria bacterium]MDZ4385488.1 sigma-70 family RNA polymerase sigma factor [Candidatus Moranbacteria bacterium]